MAPAAAARELGQALTSAGGEGQDGLTCGTFMLEVRELLQLATPLFFGMASFAVMKATDSSLLGHAGTRYLEAVSLSDLWTASTGVLIQSRAVSVLCAQAYGAGQKRQVGVWMQIAYAVLFAVMLLVAVLWCLTGTVLRSFGKSEMLSSDAQYFAVVLMLCLPVRIAFSQLNSFFTAQKHMKPGATCATAGMLTNLVLGLVFVLGVPIPGWDGWRFPACPWVTTIVEYMQFGLMWFVFCKLRQLHQECWPGWSRANITRAALKEYLNQYIPGTLSSASDWWRLTVLGVIAASLGDMNVAVWNTSYRICWIVLVFIGSVGSAMGIMVGTALGAGKPATAKRQALAGVAVAGVVLLALCILVVSIPRHFGQIFSNDPEVLDLFEESRYALALFVGMMNLAVVLEKVPVAAGEARLAFWLGVVGSWVGQVPGAYLCTRYWRDDMIGLFTGSALGYALLCVLLVLAIIRLDFDELAAKAQRRSAIATGGACPAANSGASSPGDVGGASDGAECGEEGRGATNSDSARPAPEGQ